MKLVFKNFPLASHKFARKAAAAALAAFRQDKFLEYHHLIFANYSSLDDKKLQDFAVTLNLDIAKFNDHMADPGIAGLINRDLSEGNSAGVRGTPTIFVNGKLLKQRSIQGFQEIIDRDLRKKR